MLEVHPATDGFTVYDTDAGEAVIKFTSRAEAEQMIDALQIADVPAKLQGWAPTSSCNDGQGQATATARTSNNNCNCEKSDSDCNCKDKQ